MFHSGVSSYVDNDNTRDTPHMHNRCNVHTRNDENTSCNPKELPLRLDTQLAGVGLGPCLRRRAGGGQSTAPLRATDLVTEEEHVDYVDPAYSADHWDRSDNPEVPVGRSRGRSPFPFPNATSSLSSLGSVSPAAPSSNRSLSTQYKPEQPQHKFKPYIPIPTPFEYSDDDGDDFRGHFDFDRAWAGPDSDPNMTAMQQLEGSQELAESPQMTDSSPGLSSSPSSTGSGTSYGTILTPKTPYEDQEYYDVMYKLDLGAESPYLGSAYAEAFGNGCLLSQPPPSSLKARTRGNTDSSSIDASVDVTSHASSSKHNTHCGICLRKAISPCRTKCCDRMYCRAHISDWLRSKESSGLCPSCDTVCILPPVADGSSSETVLRKRGSSSTSLSPAHSRTSSSGSTASTSSTSSSCSESGSSTRVEMRSNFSSHATLTLGDSTVGTPTSNEETEDLWDVKNTWKKNGGGSLDFVEMVREVMGDVVTGSMKFVGLSGGVRAGAGASGHRSQVTQQVKQMTTQSDAERGFKFSPKELVKEVSGFTLDLGKLGGVTEVEEVDEIGEAGVAKRMVSIVGLVVVLFVLFR